MTKQLKINLPHGDFAMYNMTGTFYYSYIKQEMFSNITHKTILITTRSLITPAHITDRIGCGVSM